MNKKFLGIILAIAAFGALVVFLKLSPGIAPFLWQWSGGGKSPCTARRRRGGGGQY